MLPFYNNRVKDKGNVGEWELASRVYINCLQNLKCTLRGNSNPIDFPS